MYYVSTHSWTARSRSGGDHQAGDHMGDVAIAVHPRSDKARLAGRLVRYPSVDGEIPIIEDNM